MLNLNYTFCSQLSTGNEDSCGAFQQFATVGCMWLHSGAGDFTSNLLVSSDQWCNQGSM